ncbi:hypothetical protein AMK59_3664 [Oryctes borbonicus]|uniref:Aftiphilin clathrin-binding box domain-containing protein n=1 Tax=Oryctes borbonicus TaxID=1629725 RepID=A0A0T6B8D7_9SCAR|nr:hypothetical protein AMK59_3664 [Oryctes borbonicus]
MSNIIPPLLSDSPPPIITPDDEEDEFGDFNSAIDTSHVYENLSLPSTPQHEPLTDLSKIENCDINSNTSIKNVEYKNHINGLFSKHIEKDFQDKRKNCDVTTALTETDVNLPKNQDDETVNSINNYKDNTLGYCEVYSGKEAVESTEREHEGMSPNGSVPTNISIHNHLSDSNTVPEVWSDLNPDRKNENCSDVPYSNNEMILDKSEEENNRLNTETSSCIIVDSDKDSSKSSLDLNTVPNAVGVTEGRDIQETSTETLKNQCYFIEEPPDLHIIDDSKVQVEDFRYYDAYDEHELVHQDQSEYNVTNDIDPSNEQFEIPADHLVQEITFDNPIGDHKSIDTNTCGNLKVEEIQNNCVSNFEIKNSIFETFSEAISSSNDNNFQSNAVDSTEQLTSDITVEFVPIAFNATNECTVTCSNELKESNNRSEVLDTFEHEAFKQEESKIIEGNTNSLGVLKFPKKEIILVEENNLEAKEICEKKDIEITCESGSKLDEVDHFSDFSKFLTDNDVEPPIEIVDTSSSNKLVDFARFDDVNFSPSTIDRINKVDNDSPASVNLVLTSNLLNTEDIEEDEFGDFGDYTQADYGSTVPAQSVAVAPAIKINKEEILKNVDRIVLEMYPTCDVSYDDFVLVDILENNKVFKSAKDVTDTNALMYQWIKSASQDKLLHALNIDTRNILYGPAWNPMMPKYAANLGLTPLEPVKSTDLASTSAQFGNSNPIEANCPATAQGDIPSAQFDWNGSGLINPLDCTQNNTMLLDLEHLVASLDLTHSSISTTQPPSPSDEFDEWEYWLKRHSKDSSQKTLDQQMNLDQLEKSAETLTPVLRTRFHSDNESVKSLQLTTDTIQDSEETSSKPDAATTTFEHEFDEFTSYQSQKPTDYSQWSNTTLLLRETHISTEHISEESQQKSCEMPGTSKADEIDDEFTDFQMSLPDSKADKEQNKNKPIRSDFSVFNAGSMLQPALEPLRPTVVSGNIKPQIPAQINWPDPGITDDEILNIELSYSRKDVLPLEEAKIEEAVTEVSDNVNKQPIQDNYNDKNHKLTIPCNFPVLVEINKNNSMLNIHADHPKVRENSKIADKKQSRSGRMWPTTASQRTSSEPIHISSTSRKDQDDEDDWSDFVCNPEPMKPAFQSKIIGSEKLQKPELKLSVPHLSQLQQPKKPIPVITPQGLLQTRIPSNQNNLSNLNVQQPSSVFQQNQPGPRNTFQPCIISHQYQNHMNGSSFSKISANGFYNGLIPQQVNQALPTPNIGKLSTSDDDDWTDFISSPPVQPAKKHSANILMGNASRTNVTNNSGVATPNIIANPVHLGYGKYPMVNRNNFGAHTRNVRKPPSSVNLGSQASTIPSISALPDLDFIAPKSRTFTKK